MIPPRSLIFLPGLDQVGSTPASRPGQPKVPVEGAGGGLSGGRLGGFPTRHKSDSPGNLRAAPSALQSDGDIWQHPGPGYRSRFAIKHPLLVNNPVQGQRVQ